MKPEIYYCYLWFLLDSHTPSNIDPYTAMDLWAMIDSGCNFIEHYNKERLGDEVK